MDKIAHVIGDFAVSGGVADTDYVYENGVLTIKGTVPVKVSMVEMPSNEGASAGTTADRIEVSTGENAGVDNVAHVTLDGVKIDVSTSDSVSAMLVRSGSLELTLKGENALKSGENCAGSDITIKGGAVTAAGQTYASGIGGGYQGAGTGIAVSGGLVSAKGGEYGGSAVGNGHNVAEAADVTIKGGAFADKLPEGTEASDKVYGVVLGEDHIAAANVVETEAGTYPVRVYTLPIYTSPFEGGPVTKTYDGEPLFVDFEPMYGDVPATYAKVEYAVHGTGQWSEVAPTAEGAYDVRLTVPAAVLQDDETGAKTYWYGLDVTFDDADGSAPLVIEAAPAPPPARPTYPPTVPDADGGSVEVMPSRPHRGDEVTVTPKPEEGQEVREVAVADAEGGVVEVTGNGDGTWTFVQPAGKVTIEVAFGFDGGELCAAHGYADVDPDQWYHDAVDWAVTSGTMTGYADGTYGPADALSRAQLATVLWRLAGEPEGAAELPADCGEGEFYSGAVSWALGEGVFSGYESGLFGPADPLTREQAATVLWRAAGSPEAECDLSAYPDARDVSEFASAAVRWAVNEGVLRGRGDGTLDPRGACSRAEVATLMMRLAVQK